MDLDELSGVTALVYEAALQPARWPQVLGRLSRMFQCPFADRYQRMEDYSEFCGVQVGLDDADYNDVFLGVWVRRNVWGTKRPVRRAGDVVTTRDIMPVEALRRTEMYNDYLAPRGLHEGLRLDLWAGEGWIECVSLLRPWSTGSYSRTEIAMARLLLPHLQAAAAVARRLRLADGLAQAGLAALDLVQASVLLLDGQGRMVHGNTAGMALLRSTDALTAHSAGLLAAGSGPLTQRLHAMLRSAAGRPGTPPRCGALQLPRPGGGPPLALLALPLRQGDGAPGAALPGFDRADAPVILLCIVDPSRGTDVDQAQLSTLFGLTPSEAALATSLLSGQDLSDIAEATGRSVNTLRTQLAKLMAKTDTTRQSELVRLLSRLPRGVAETV